MELLDVRRSVLLVIDLQGKLMDQVERPPLVIEATNRLMRLADLFEVPVLLTEQYPKGLGSTHAEVLATFNGLTTKTARLEKTAFGCCGDPAFEGTLSELAGVSAERRQVVVAGIEARGFIFGTAVAYELGVGFVPIRKAGKLPGEVIGIDYELEYGSDRMEMHTDAIPSGAEVLLIDDLIAGVYAAVITQVVVRLLLVP